MRVYKRNYEGKERLYRGEKKQKTNGDLCID